MQSGARYAYLFDRNEVEDACSSACAPVFEVLLLRAVETCSEVWSIYVYYMYTHKHMHVCV
jgi:hypothetical protein